MRWTRRRFMLGCLLAAVPARVLADRAPSTQGATSLAGQLLVAAPGMSDPRFVRSVILMVQHDATGAMGVAINRKLGDEPVAALLQAIGEKAAGAHGSVAVFAGGPVEPAAALVVHSAEYRLPATLALDAHVAVSSPRQVLRDIGAGRGPRKRMLMFGYAGWAPKQLEAELTLRAWVTVPEHPELVFDMDRAKVWEAALGRHTLSL